MELLICILAISIPLIALSWLLPKDWQLIPISILTAVFIGIHSPVSLVVLSSTALISFFCIRYMQSLITALLIVVIQMSTIFIFFKLEYGVYFNITADRILPLGLSYYSFRQIHYAIESYKKQIPKHQLIDYLNYLFFLPTILVGPINRFQDFIKDMNRRRFDQKQFSYGLERILYGFVKIIFIGNFLFTHKLDRVAKLMEQKNEWLGAYLQMIKFAGNAFVQFAGYSDVAIGLSLLFGFRIIENFNWPFTASNINEFWNRWHISLSDWCRNYVFYPFLGITRNAKLSIIISMFVLALWHEISLRYILWGLAHALAISIWHQYKSTRIYQLLSRFPFLQKGIGIFVTIHFVVLSFVIIKEDSIEASIEVYKILFLIA